MPSDSATTVLAVFVLAVLGLALVCWTIVCYRRKRYTPTQFFLYVYVTIMARIAWRAKVSRPLPAADDQGAVVVSNHISGIDPAFIAMSTRRPVHWMVAKEFWQNPVLAWFFRIMGGIPVSRNGIDTAATKLAIRHAKNGELVGIFPEGRINTTDRLLLPGRPGAALIALKARVPVVPCFIRGAPYGGSVFGPLFMTAKAELRVGEPIEISNFYGREGEDGVLEELTQRFLVEIAKLAGHLDYVPQLAGRRWKPGMEEAAVPRDAD